MLAVGYIIIDSPAGVEIYLDGEYQGLTSENDFIIEKSAGDYQLTAEKIGHYPEKLEVEVESLSSSSIRLQMIEADILTRNLSESERIAMGIETGSLEIRSVPYQGGDIFLNGEYLGQSNNIFENVLAGELSLRVSIDGYDLQKKIKLEAGEAKVMLAHYALNPPTLIEIFELSFAGILPENYFIEIEGEYSTSRVRDISKAVTLMGAAQRIKINNGSQFLAYQKDIDLREDNFVTDLPFPDHNLNMVYVEVDSTPSWIEINDDYYISKYNVTQAEFERVMGFNPSRFINPLKPVHAVSWYDAVMFCNKLSELDGLDKYYNLSQIVYYGESSSLDGDPKNIKSAQVSVNKEANGYRLPTVSEHEYAARGGKYAQETKYAGSNNLNEVAWNWRNSGDHILNTPPITADGLTDITRLNNNNNRIRPVGLKKANELDLYDMTGNVWDWNGSFYEGLAYRRGASYRTYSKVSDEYRLMNSKMSSPEARWHDFAFRIARNK